jgi:sulfate transport system substrate-binding protein
MLLRPAPLFRIAAALLAAGGASTLAAQDKILNASFDVSRELFREINPAFRAKWKADTGRDVDIEQSHVGSTQQARAVLDGLQADVVTLNQQTDMDALMRAGLVAADWRARLPFHAAPYTSIVVFVVRAGNPKHIRDWDDLLQPGIRVSLVNPKTSGNGRYAFLGAWAFASSRKGGGYSGAKAFVTGLYRNVPVLDLGGRAATSTFADRGLTDVLITFESEGRLLQRKFGAARFEIVTPSITLLAEFPGFPGRPRCRMASTS